MLSEPEASKAANNIAAIVANVETVIQGKHDAVELVVLALIARGHVLLEDLPGTGKTTLASTLAKSIDCDFKRIQFTPDVMPSDVTGFSVYNQQTNEFEFRPGGVMSNLVLADEINRASAKTQSALLEAMEERQVTVDSKTFKLDEPFMVLATQNPIEQYGTFPLPEAQLDRFLIKLSMGYADFSDELHMLELGDRAKRAIGPVATTDDVLRLCDQAEQVEVSPDVFRYILEIVTATRNRTDIRIGSSPRGGIALVSLSRAWALARGRAYVLPEDVKRLAPYTLGHRIALTRESKSQGRISSEVIESILSSIAVPIGDDVLIRKR